MPKFEVEIDELELLDAVSASDVVSYFDAGELLDAMDIGDIRGAAFDRSKPHELLEFMNARDIKRYLEELGYDVSKNES